MAKQYGTFDEVNIGSSLALTFGDQILQTTASVNAHRLARSAFGLAAFQGNVEALFWSPNASSPGIVSVSGVPPLSIGVVLAADTLSGFVGEGAGGYGYCPGDGKVYHNNAVVVTLATSTFGDQIGVNVDPVNLGLTFTKNGVPLGAPITIASGQTWFYAASLSGAPGALAWLVNAGQTPIRYPLGIGGGFWQPTTSIPPINLSTVPLISLSTDSLPNVKYGGDIERMQSPPKFPRSVNVWVWGDSKPSQLSSGAAQIEITILDPNNIYSPLTNNDIRDVPVPIQRGKRGASVDAFENVFFGIIDRVEVPTDQTKLLYLTDRRATLQQPLNRALFPPNVDPSVAGKPLPMSLGICRNYVPSLFDPVNLLYAAHDSNLSALGIERNAGKAMADPTDFTLTPDASGFDLVAAPPGKFTVESTSTGTAYNPATGDLLSGAGVFTGVSPDGNGQPTGWSCFPATSPYWQVSGAGLTEPSAYGRSLTMRYTGLTLTAGTTYVAEVVLSAVPYSGVGFGGEINPATLEVGLAVGSGVYTTVFNGSNLSIVAPGTYTFTIQNSTASNYVLGVSMTSGNYGGLNNLVMTSLRIQALPAVATNVALGGLGLSAMLKGILCDRGPLTTSAVAFADSDAIDAATGYVYGLHLDPDDQPTVAVTTKRLLDCVCGDIFPARDGLNHIFRLIAPELVASGSVTGSLTVTDIQGYLTPSPDNAENLSTRLSGCTNYSPYSDGDFGSTSLTDCPLATRAQLKLAYQWTAVSGVQLSPKYFYSYNVNPLETLFDLLSDGQKEIQRVCKLYTSPRWFYVGTFFSPIGRQFELGQVWKVTYPIGSLVAGQQLLIVGLTESPSEETTELVFWGL